MSAQSFGELRVRLLDQIHDDPEMSPADQSVCYGIIRSLMRDTGKAQVSNAELAAKTHRDLRTVTRGIKNAIRLGHFRIESKCRGDRSFIPVLKAVEGQISPSKPKNRGAGIHLAEGDICHSRVAEHPPKTSTGSGFPKSPSLHPSLNPHTAGPSDPAVCDRKGGNPKKPKKLSKQERYDKPYSPEFERFWEAYPPRAG